MRNRLLNCPSEPSAPTPDWFHALVLAVIVLWWGWAFASGSATSTRSALIVLAVLALDTGRRSLAVRRRVRRMPPRAGSEKASPTVDPVDV